MSFIFDAQVQSQKNKNYIKNVLPDGLIEIKWENV